MNRLIRVDKRCPKLAPKEEIFKDTNYLPEFQDSIYSDLERVLTLRPVMKVEKREIGGEQILVLVGHFIAIDNGTNKGYWMPIKLTLPSDFPRASPLAHVQQDACMMPSAFVGTDGALNLSLYTETTWVWKKSTLELLLRGIKKIVDLYPAYQYYYMGNHLVSSDANLKEMNDRMPAIFQMHQRKMAEAAYLENALEMSKNYREIVDSTVAKTKEAIDMLKARMEHSNAPKYVIDEKTKKKAMIEAENEALAKTIRDVQQCCRDGKIGMEAALRAIRDLSKQQFMKAILPEMKQD